MILAFYDQHRTGWVSEKIAHAKFGIKCYLSFPFSKFGNLGFEPFPFLFSKSKSHSLLRCKC